MPNLINTDNAGNVFYNYITPVVKGESITSWTNTTLQTLFDTAGVPYAVVNTGRYNFRLAAPGLEMKTGAISSQSGTSRFWYGPFNNELKLNTDNTNTSSSQYVDIQTNPMSVTYPAKLFGVVNDYAFCMAWFNANGSLAGFHYLGWLREPSFTGISVGVLGLVGLNSTQALYKRPSAANSTLSVELASAADAITSPPIVCTTGTDPGDDSETATDIVIRDAASPYNPVGKLWNCIDLPATTAVGDLVKNVGAYDGDGDVSEQDVYLCVMDWGTRKLGMRVWTEGVT